METSLIDRWLETPDVIVVDATAVAVARERVRDVGAGLPLELVETMALVTSELLVNQLRHAAGGRFAVQRIERDGVAGLEIVAADRGPGLADAPRALAGAVPRATGSMGQGVAAVFRLADEVDVDVRIGEGTCFRARKLVTSPRFRSEVAIFGRACPGERISGDDAAFVRRAHETTLLLADGLGHGPDARLASARATSSLGAGRAPNEIVRDADRALNGTRGATMAVVRCDAAAGTLQHAGVGDVFTRLERDRARKSTKLAGQSGTVGVGRLGERSVRVDDDVFAPADTLIMTTDGIVSEADGVRALGRHPLLVAHELVDKHARARDDALVIVARVG